MQNIVERSRWQERLTETGKESAMAQKRMAIGVENRKGRLVRPFELVEIRGVEPLTFSMPLRTANQKIPNK